MLYRISVVLAGATVALTGLVAAGMGSAGASPTTLTATESPSPTPTPRPTPTCPPVLPITGAATAVTATSVTITYAIFLTPPCGYNPPVTVVLFASQEDAQLWQNPLAEIVSGPERSGTVTFSGLTPDTPYWFRFGADGRQVPYPIGTARTAPTQACTATAVINNTWSTGFIATVTVRSTGTETLPSWRTTWQWPGNQRIVAAWGGVVETSGTTVTVRNASYNGTLAPGASTTFGMLVEGGTPLPSFYPTCSR